MIRTELLASLLLLLAGSYAVVAHPQALKPVAPITITGRVQAEGKPLPDAVITLWQAAHGDDPNERTTVASGRTNTEGNYELKNVPDGNYRIRASASGFVTGHENNMLDNFRFVTVVGAQTVGPFNFELLREGVISGVVTGADGKPLAGVPITITTKIVPDGLVPKYAESLRTDDQGRYRVAGIPSGKYRVAAGYYPLILGSYRGRPVYQRVFYPNAATESEARVIDIGAGSEVTGIDFNLGHPAKTFKVLVRIIDERTGKPLEGLDCHLRTYLNGKAAGGRGSFAPPSNDRGEIVLADVPAGEYLISVPGFGGFRKDGPQTPNYNGESAHFQVTDKDLTVEMRVSKAASVAGSVVIEGSRADLLARVSEVFLSGVVQTSPVSPTPIVYATIRPDGSFFFTGLRAGTMKFYVQRGATLPLQFVRTEQNGVELDGDLPIQLGDEITGIKLVMAYATGGVHGVVKLDDGSVPSGFTGMASVSQGNKPTPFRSVMNQNGEFILPNLVAGEYKLMVVAHDAIGRNWQFEQKIKVDDDKVREAKIVLDSKVKPNPSAASKSYLQP